MYPLSDETLPKIGTDQCSPLGLMLLRMLPYRRTRARSPGPEVGPEDDALEGRSPQQQHGDHRRDILHACCERPGVSAMGGADVAVLLHSHMVDLPLVVDLAQRERDHQPASLTRRSYRLVGRRRQPSLDGRRLVAKESAIPPCDGRVIRAYSAGPAEARREAPWRSHVGA